MLPYYKWLTQIDDDGLENRYQYYILNLPVQDVSDEAETGFFLPISLPENNLQSREIEFSFNNSSLEHLEEDDYKELKDGQKISLLWQKAFKVSHLAIKTIFRVDENVRFLKSH